MGASSSKGAMDSLRIVLLGKTGDGKSSCGNTILNIESFLTKNSPISVTHICESKTKSINGTDITVVDTPGFFDTDLPEEKSWPVILRCMIDCAPGPHAFVIVLKVGRFTEHEKEIVRKITTSFGEEALKYTVVLFTHGDDLAEGEKIEDFVGKSKELKEFVKKCGGRVHVVDNKYWNQTPEENYRSNKFQVEKLLNTIEEMVEKNGGHYTNEMLQKVNTEIEANCQSIRSDGNKDVSDMNIKKQAKEEVYAYLLKTVTGVTTGMLLGALLGVKGGIMILPLIFGGARGVVAAAVGATAGGCVGYNAADQAESVPEAAKNTVMTLIKKIN